ncbi:MAG: hypothetical protein AcusKO_17570 [Acuticoccus sp.]
MKRSILAAMVLSLALAGCNTSYNYFEDDDEGAPDPGPFNLAQTVMRHSGVMPKEQRQLAYKPRAPLAVPSNSDLPTPQNGTNNAEAAVNFPTDHEAQDEARKQELATLLGTNEGPDGSPGTRKTSAVLPAEALQSGEAREEGPDIWGDPVKYMRDIRKKKITFRNPGAEILNEDGAAAPRKYLIQPPEEYRTPAQTAALPEKKDIENSEWLKKQLYRDVEQK